MVRRLLVTALLVGIVAGASSAATIGMNVSQLGANGWNTVIKADSDGRGSVTDRVQSGSNGLQFTNGDNGKTTRCWSAISTANYAGVAASSISSLKMRVYGTEGDGSAWQPPAFLFAFKRAPANLSNRYAWWLPWLDGTPRAPGTWQEYDAMTDGQWFVPNAAGARFATFAALRTAYPDLTFASDAEIATMSADFGAGATGAAHSFNVGHFSYYNDVATYHDSARGTVDWFEIGLNGNVTRYDLNDVPEPATLMVLLTGMGLVCIRRNRR